HASCSGRSWRSKSCTSLDAAVTCRTIAEHHTHEGGTMDKAAKTLEEGPAATDDRAAEIAEQVNLARVAIDKLVAKYTAAILATLPKDGTESQRRTDSEDPS